MKIAFSITFCIDCTNISLSNIIKHDLINQYDMTTLTSRNNGASLLNSLGSWTLRNKRLNMSMA